MNTETATATNDITFHDGFMAIGKRVNGKKVFDRFQPYGLITLDQVATGFPAPDSWKDEELKEGDKTQAIKIPVYNDPQVAYLQEALTKAAQVAGRSKGDQPPAMNWSELLESSSQGAYGSQMKLYNESFEAYLGQVGVPAEVIPKITRYNDTRRLGEADQTIKDRYAAHLEGFVTAIGDQVSEVGSVVTSLRKAIALQPEACDW